MQIILGPLADDLSEQFKKAVVEYVGKTSIELIQKSADAISLLDIRGYLSESEARKARERLMKEIKVREV